MAERSLVWGLVALTIAVTVTAVSGVAFAQGEARGLYILEGRGPVYHEGAPPAFPGEPFLGIDIARDMATVTGPDNSITGYFILDGFGNIFEVGDADLGSITTTNFGFDIARDMEVLQPGYFPATVTTPADTLGLYVLDGMGGVHAYGSAITLPNSDNGIFDTNTNTPEVDPFFGFDIARDFELSRNVDGPTAGHVNGYYILDGFGGVHTGGQARDMLIRPVPGLDIVVPFFGFDIARAMEIHPTGTGIYILDGYGGVTRIGAALQDFPLGGPEQTPVWGWDIAEDIELITDGTDDVLGYFVLSGFGDIAGAGIAERFPYPGPPIFQDLARDLETTLWLEGETLPQIGLAD